MIWSRIHPYLVLMRPANIITAIADIWAGAMIAGFVFTPSISYALITDFLGLTLATIGLYGGGVVFNDYFDAAIDTVERPERPIPSGKVSRKAAALLGGSLLLTGIISAFLISIWSGWVALAIGGLALFYDAYAKHHAVLGPFTMGLCRSMNLMLGLSIIPKSVFQYGFLGIVPLIFIAAITLSSQKEVSGNNRSSMGIAILLDISVILILLFIMGYHSSINTEAFFFFLSLWGIVNLSAKWNAFFNNHPKNIMRAVKIGVLSLIPLNASYAAAFGGWVSGLIVLALLPISLLLAKPFRVT